MGAALSFFLEWAERLAAARPAGYTPPLGLRVPLGTRWSSLLSPLVCLGWSSPLEETALWLPLVDSAEDPTAAVIDALAREFTVRQAPAPTTARRYYDTFDGRLHRRRSTLAVVTEESAPPRLVWRRRDNAGGVQESGVDAPDSLGFAGELPAGSLRDGVAACIEMRRLLPFLEVESGGLLLEISDALAKTTVRLRVERQSARLPGGEAVPMPAMIHVHPLRGFEAESRAVVEALRTMPSIADSAPDRIDLAIDALGLDTPRDRAKVAIDLPEDAAADEAVAIILLSFLQVIQLHEAGVRDEIDSEFLHDYRVAIRKTRAWIGQLKRVFPAEAIGKFKEEFAWLGRGTGAARDADVFLLRLDDYVAEIPDGDFALLRKHLEESQRAAYDEIRGMMATPRYRDLISGWDAFLRSYLRETPAPKERVEIGTTLARDVFAKRIWKIYRRITRARSARDPRAPAQALHDVRLDGKKLRYLLDGSKSLFDAAAVQTGVRELKRLQDVLGDFNDFEVQQERLTAIADELLAEGDLTKGAGPVLTLGRLCERLRQRSLEERARFRSRFDRFAADKNQERYRDLFGPRADSGTTGP